MTPPTKRMLHVLRGLRVRSRRLTDIRRHEHQEFVFYGISFGRWLVGAVNLQETDMSSYEHHRNDNDDCPLNDPETHCHPATKGLGCTCKPEPKAEASPAAAPPASADNTDAIVQKVLDRLDARAGGVKVPDPPDLKQLAQAALDLVVGFRIRASGARIQIGYLEHMTRINDLETAKAVSLIVTTAAQLGCQGVELLTPFDETDDDPSGGIFGPHLAEMPDGTVLEGRSLQRYREEMDHGESPEGLDRSRRGQ